MRADEVIEWAVFGLSPNVSYWQALLGHDAMLKLRSAKGRGPGVAPTRPLVPALTYEAPEYARAP
jgi:hypothetical protein